MPRQPQAAPGSVGIAAIGVEVADLTDSMMDDLGFRKGTRGVVITNMYRSSPAVDAGLRIGDIITKVDGKGVRNAQEALALPWIKLA